METLTAKKELQYRDMQAMREAIKAVETLKKAAEKLVKEEQTQSRSCEHNKTAVQKFFHTAACAFIFRTTRCASRCEPVSVPAHRPQCGKLTANLEGRDTHDVLPNSR